MTQRPFKYGYAPPDGYRLRPCDCTCAMECPYGHVGSEERCCIVERLPQEWPVPRSET
jgi:hypothetical protein